MMLMDGALKASAHAQNHDIISIENGASLQTFHIGRGGRQRETFASGGFSEIRNFA
jgi:hypothetical protein